jgi:hypothetical protein
MRTPVSDPIGGHDQCERAQVGNEFAQRRALHSDTAGQRRKAAVDFSLYERRQQRLIVPPHTAANEDSLRIENGRQVVQGAAEPARRFLDGVECRCITPLRITEDDLKWLAEMFADIAPADHALEIAAIATAAQRLRGL